MEASVSKQNKIITWVVFYLCVTVASSAGFVFPLGDDNLWYTTLKEPSFAPPSWVFAPVWTTLYLLIATSAYRIVVKSNYTVNNPCYNFILFIHRNLYFKLYYCLNMKTSSAYK